MSDLYRPLEGRQTTPRLRVTCKDGHPMVLRTNGVTGQDFLGCSRWPDCNRTRKVPEYLRLKLAGAAELPGMGDL